MKNLVIGFEHVMIETHVMQIIPDISNLLKQLDVIIRTKFASSTLDGINSPNTDGKLLDFCLKLKGLGILIFSKRYQIGNIIILSLILFKIYIYK